MLKNYFKTILKGVFSVISLDDGRKVKRIFHYGKHLFYKTKQIEYSWST